MARQPFFPIHKNKPVRIGHEIIEELPKVAELVGRIAVNWSGVDAQLSVMLGSLLGVENTASVAVFTALRNHRAQRDALRAAASGIQNEEIRDIFEAILSIHENLDKQRNDYIHCIWGVSSALPNEILWSSVQAHATMLINAYHMEKTGQHTHDSRKENIEKSLSVLQLADLEELNKNIKLLVRHIGSFHSYLRYASIPAGKYAYDELLRDPAIIAARTKKRDKDSRS